MSVLKLYLTWNTNLLPDCIVERNSERLNFSLVNKANLVHNLFLVYLSISTCFGRLRAHHQEKQRFFCDTWYLLVCVDDCLVCWVYTRQSSIQTNKYQVSQKKRCFSWWWARSRPKHVEINNCAPSWPYLQDYTEMHGHRNIKTVSDPILHTDICKGPGVKMQNLHGRAALAQN